jgi:hypothetical protein
MHVPGLRQGDTEANMISWMEGTLGFSQDVATNLYQNQLLKFWKEFSDMSDENIDRVIAAIWHDLKESIAKIAVV